MAGLFVDRTWVDRALPRRARNQGVQRLLAGCWEFAERGLLIEQAFHLFRGRFAVGDQVVHARPLPLN